MKHWQKYLDDHESALMPEEKPHLCVTLQGSNKGALRIRRR